MERLDAAERRPRRCPFGGWADQLPAAAATDPGAVNNFARWSILTSKLEVR